MQISENDWIKYKNKLASISDKAADEMVQWLQTKGGYQNVSRSDLIDYAYALSTKYGEASASLSALMYDEIAEKSGVVVPSAVVADTATYSEVAKAVNGVTKKLTTDKQVGSVVGRTVKQAGADTTLKNAKRDGAQFAWVPAGDTCVFCLALASNGWQYMSKNSSNHADHIHPHCDCTYAVRFDDKTTVKGYDPEKYKKIFENAEGDTWNEKINSVRRMQYQENKDKINAQKREAYKINKNILTINKKETNMNVAEQTRQVPGNVTSTIISPKIQTQEYANKMKLLGENEKITSIMTFQSRKTLYRRNGTLKEDLIFINPNNNECLSQRRYNVDEKCVPTEEMKKMVLDNPRTIIAIHNHPRNMLPSYDDLENAQRYKYGVIICHNGDIIKYTVLDNANIDFADMILNDMQDDFLDLEKRNKYIDMLKDGKVILEVIS